MAEYRSQILISIPAFLSNLTRYVFWKFSVFNIYNKKN